MKYYILLHEHRHGVDCFLFKTKKDIGDTSDIKVANLLDVDFTPNSDEYLEVIEVSPEGCVEI